MQRTFSLMVVSMALSTWAAEPAPGGAQLLLELQRLSVVGSALYVAAHPDDENTRLLASLAQGVGVRATYLAFTRGEGGQNLIGPELGPGLSVIRTQELLAARRLDGAEQRFTRARDFGYSKSVGETLEVWDHQAVLLDAVRVIRSQRPDVIITRFPLEAGDTHGHHTASARLALEAFTAAGDPGFQPEALAGLPPWKATRIVWNAWSGDRGRPVPAGAMRFDTSAYSPLLGRTFGEVAAESRSQHRSQGFGAAPVHGPSVESFVLLGGAPGAGLFEGVDLSWKRVPGGEKVAALLARAEAAFDVRAPHKSLPALLEVRDALLVLAPGPERDFKVQALERLLAGCAGLFLEARAADFAAVSGGPVELSLTALARLPAGLTLVEARLPDGQVLPGGALEPGVAWAQKATVRVPASAPLANPFWLEAPPLPGRWAVEDAALAVLPERPAALAVDFVLGAGARRLTLTRPVAYLWVDPTAGERARPLEVLPPVTVAPAEKLVVFPDGTARPLEVKVTAQADGQTGELALELPPGWSATPARQPFSLPKRGAEAVLRFEVRPGAGTPAGTATLTAAATVGGQRFARGLTRIEYPHLPIQALLPPAEVRLTRVELKRGPARIGYLEGAGDEVARSLRQAGYQVTVLDDAAMAGAPESLARFDAVVLGVRAYNVNPRLPGWREGLLRYVERGGTVVVQYNTRNWLSSVPAEVGPYPFTISQDRVTDETAEVRFEAPVHPVLTTPNRLGPADFEGWVQERGLYFAGPWDPRYQAPLSMHDPGEAPLKGSLLVARHGKGTFVYTGLAFFRQLPAGVPGAYRLFANLLSAHGT